MPAADLIEPYLPEERLEILRRFTPEQTWESLDDKRICIVCHRIIVGREIVIERTADGPAVRCPTAGCVGTPAAWAFHSSATRGTRTAEFSFL